MSASVSASVTSAAGSTTTQGPADGSTSLILTTGSSEGTTAGNTASPLLWTTLDDVNAVTVPMQGDGTDASVSSTTTTSFVPTPWGGGVEVQEMGQWVRFRQIAEQPNIEFDRGTIDLQFRPSYDHDDGVLHRLLATDDSPSGLRIRKNANGRFVVVLDNGQPNGDHITAVAPSDYEWSADQWIHVYITWDTTDPNMTQPVHIYFDGSEVNRYVALPQRRITMGSEDPEGWIYVGTRSDTADNVANGILDELKIYDEPIPPPPP